MPTPHQQFFGALQDNYRQLHETHGEAFASEFVKQLFAPFARPSIPNPRCRPIQGVVEAASKAMTTNTADTWTGATAYAAWASLCSDIRSLALNQSGDNGGYLGAARGPLGVVYPMIADIPRKLMVTSWGLIAEAAPVIVRRATDRIRVQPLVSFNVSAWNVPTREMYDLYGALQAGVEGLREGWSCKTFDDWHDPAGSIIRTGDLVAALADSLTGVTQRDAPEANPNADLLNVLFQGEWKATKATLSPR